MRLTGSQKGSAYRNAQARNAALGLADPSDEIGQEINDAIMTASQVLAEMPPMPGVHYHAEDFEVGRVSPSCQVTAQAVSRPATP